MKLAVVAGREIASGRRAADDGRLSRKAVENGIVVVIVFNESHVEIVHTLRTTIGGSQASRAIRTAALGTGCPVSTCGLSTEWSPPAL